MSLAGKTYLGAAPPPIAKDPRTMNGMGFWGLGHPGIPMRPIVDPGLALKMQAQGQNVNLAGQPPPRPLLAGPGAWAVPGGGGGGTGATRTGGSGGGGGFIGDPLLRIGNKPNEVGTSATGQEMGSLHSFYAAQRAGASPWEQQNANAIYQQRLANTPIPGTNNRNATFTNPGTDPKFNPFPNAAPGATLPLPLAPQEIQQRDGGAPPNPLMPAPAPLGAPPPPQLAPTPQGVPGAPLPMRGAGGPMVAGQPYIVGDRGQPEVVLGGAGAPPTVVGQNGPEIITPGSNGYVLPNVPSFMSSRGYTAPSDFDPWGSGQKNMTTVPAGSYGSPSIPLPPDLARTGAEALSLTDHTYGSGSSTGAIAGTEYGKGSQVQDVMGQPFTGGAGNANPTGNAAISSVVPIDPFAAPAAPAPAIARAPGAPPAPLILAAAPIAYNADGSQKAANTEWAARAGAPPGFTVNPKQDDNYWQNKMEMGQPAPSQVPFVMAQHQQAQEFAQRENFLNWWRQTRETDRQDIQTNRQQVQGQKVQAGHLQLTQISNANPTILTPQDLATFTGPGGVRDPAILDTIVKAYQKRVDNAQGMKDWQDFADGQAKALGDSRPEIAAFAQALHGVHDPKMAADLAKNYFPKLGAAKEAPKWVDFNQGDGTGAFMANGKPVEGSKVMRRSVTPIDDPQQGPYRTTTDYADLSPKAPKEPKEPKIYEVAQPDPDSPGGKRMVPHQVMTDDQGRTYLQPIPVGAPQSGGGNGSAGTANPATDKLKSLTKKLSGAAPAATPPAAPAAAPEAPAAPGDPRIGGPDEPIKGSNALIKKWDTGANAAPPNFQIDPRHGTFASPMPIIVGNNDVEKGLQQAKTTPAELAALAQINPKKLSAAADENERIKQAQERDEIENAFQPAKKPKK